MMQAVIPAETPMHFDQARRLFEEYAASLNFDLEFQNFREEIADIRGAYGAPRGGVLLACRDGRTAGCVALRDLGGTICEMKRLYVKPGFRGLRLGRLLAQAVIHRAREMGYTAMRLDTIVSMESAIRLYRSLGFRPIDPYRINPVPGAAFFELIL